MDGNNDEQSFFDDFWSSVGTNADVLLDENILTQPQEKAKEVESDPVSYKFRLSVKCVVQICHQNVSSQCVIKWRRQEQIV